MAAAGGDGDAGGGGDGDPAGDDAVGDAGRYKTCPYADGHTAAHGDQNACSGDVWGDRYTNTPGNVGKRYSDGHSHVQRHADSAEYPCLRANNHFDKLSDRPGAFSAADEGDAVTGRGAGVCLAVSVEGLYGIVNAVLPPWLIVVIMVINFGLAFRIGRQTKMLSFALLGLALALTALVYLMFSAGILTTFLETRVGGRLAIASMGIAIMSLLISLMVNQRR